MKTALNDKLHFLILFFFCLNLETTQSDENIILKIKIFKDDDQIADV